MSIRIGTSGWMYDHWKQVFYPDDLKKEDWLPYYAERFDTVEINNSFYHLPKPETFDHWAKLAPKDFQYAVKASRYITHMKKLKDPEEPLKTFFENAGRLGEKIGPVLYQLPPNWNVNRERLEHFFKTLPDGYRHVLEFRNGSWLTDEIYDLMRSYEIAFCIHDLTPPEMPLITTSELVYIRFHGQKTHDGNYSDDDLEQWAARIKQWNSAGKMLYAYFNNDVHGYALKNAETLKKMVNSEL